MYYIVTKIQVENQSFYIIYQEFHNWDLNLLQTTQDMGSLFA